MARCAACGRRGRVGALLRTLPFLAVCTWAGNDPGPHPAGTPLCWSHRVRAAEDVAPRPRLDHEYVCPHVLPSPWSCIAGTLAPGEVVIVIGYPGDRWRAPRLPRFTMLDAEVCIWRAIGARPTAPAAEEVLA